MEDTHPSTNPLGDDEVARLCLHTGASVKMDYGLFSSGAYDKHVDNAFDDHFFYDSDVYCTGFKRDEVVENIQWLRPVYMSGDSDGGGHAWVLYGYNITTEQYRMNMGWDGDWDGWYTKDTAEGPWDGNIFDSGLGLVSDIAPLNVKFVGAGNSGKGNPDDPYRDIEEAKEKAPDNTILIFRAGTTNFFTGNTIVIDKPLTLKGYDVTIKPEPRTP
jgi:hypothetical protein